MKTRLFVTALISAVILGVTHPALAAGVTSKTGATGVSASGVTYTCKTSPTDTRNRWRQ